MRVITILGIWASAVTAETLVIPETVVTAGRIEEESGEVSYTAVSLSSGDFLEGGARTLPEVLGNVPGIMVQKTTHGHGSPFIRGFTGRQNLLLVDGIRVNNSTFRAGPLQYWNTVDPYAVEQFEVVKGQGSVQFGSDAFGGTVNTITRSSGFAEEGEGWFSHGAAYYRFDTNSASHVGRFEASFGQGGKWGILLGVTAKDYGDIRDSALGTMKNTGYPEQDLDLRFDLALNEQTTLTIAHHRVNQDDVWRWHSTVLNPGWMHDGHLTAPGTDLRRVLDQERSLTYARLQGETLSAWAREWEATVSWQSSQDSEDRIRAGGQRDRKVTEVETLGLSVQATADPGFGELLYGVDYYHDDVDTRGSRNGVPRPQNRPVADDATYESLGVFGTWKFTPVDPLEVTVGARFSYVKAAWDRYRPEGAAADMSGENDWTDLSLSLRGLYHLTDNLQAYGGVSQGFRAPNLDDLTGTQFALNGLDSKGSPNLDPEEFVSVELGTRFENETVTAGVAGFYTRLDEAIVRVLDAGGALVPVNASEGYLYGFEAQGEWRFAPQWALSGQVWWLDGQVESPATLGGATRKDTIRRAPPLTAAASLRWTSASERFWVEGRVNAVAEADNLSQLEKTPGNDDQRIPVNGTPGYLVPSLHGGWQATENLTLTLGLENLTDEDYRIHGSGVNEPGFNAIIGVKAGW
jgi:hemoglobin/transferrin/lactoferrin receptor protein